MTTFLDALDSETTLLVQGSVSDRVGRQAAALDPDIGVAALIYDPEGARMVREVHASYMAVAREAGRPLLSMASTWRVDQERLGRSRFADRDVNGDHVALLRSLATEMGVTVHVAGSLGPRGDAYDATQGLARREAAEFHRAQVEALAAARPDCLVAQTLPAVAEALGLADAMATTDLPYLLSFVIDANGRVLDGTPLLHAIERIDREAPRAPWGYLINCVHPRTVAAAARALRGDAGSRLLGLRANASAKTPAELDASEEVFADAPELLAADLKTVQRQLGLKLVGGCCGTGTEHIRAMAREIP